MKKALSVLLLLSCFFVKAQDTTTINQLVNASSIDQVKNTSDKIINASSQKYVYYKTSDSSLREEKYKVVLYTLASVTDADNTKLSDIEKENLIKVYWFDKGNNYSFKEVYGPEETLKPFWVSTFSASLNEYRVNPDLKYKYITNENSVSIVKSY